MAFWHRHKYYYSQNVSNLNNGWLPDPISTYAAIGVASGQGASGSVLEGVRTGRGIDLLKYYQYANKRFKERTYLWEFNRVSDSQNANSVVVTSEEELESLIPETKGIEKRIIYENRHLTVKGVKFLADMKSIYGLDSFNTSYKGNNVLIEELGNAKSLIDGLNNYSSNSWNIGFDLETGQIPVFILGSDVDESKLTFRTESHIILDNQDYEPEPSAGIVYWTSSKGKEVTEPYIIESPRIGITNSIMSNIFNKLIENDITEIGKSFEIEYSDWEDPRYNYDTGITDEKDVGEDPSKIDVDTLEDMELETITTKKYTILNKHTDPQDEDKIIRLDVSVETQKSVITYDTEHFIWFTENDSTTPNLDKHFQKLNKALNYRSEYSSKKGDKTFKPYTMLPIREAWNWLVNIDDPNFGKVVRANDTVKKDIPETDELESDTQSTKEASKIKKDFRTKETDASKKARKILSRQDRLLRNVAVNMNTEHNKSPERIERDLEQLSDYVGLDYKSLAANIASTPSIEDNYDIWVMPAVQLATDLNDVMVYWEEYWKRMYTLLGDGGYKSFVQSVNALKADAIKNGKTHIAAKDLPRFQFHYSNSPTNSPLDNHLEGGFNGSLGFAFIRKFTVKGTIRSIKRKRDLHDIRRGRHSYLMDVNGNIAIEHIEDLLNPSEEFADDKYYTTKSGKDIHIGGAQDFSNGEYLSNGDSTTVTFGRWGYTFFCKPISKDEVSVIAVAGLAARTKAGRNESYLWGAAWFELGMEYSRNYKKYVQKLPPAKQDVSFSHRTGSKKRRKYSRIHYFFVLPLDYNVCRRMGGVRLTRFADRALLSVSYAYQHQKSIAGWVGTFLKIAAIVVAAVISWYTGGSGAEAGLSFLDWVTASLSAITLESLLTNIAMSILINMAVNYGLQLLIKTFGLNGLIAVIIATIGLIITSMVSPNFQISSLPYASEVSKAVISQGVNQYNMAMQNKVLEIQEQIDAEGVRYTEAMENLEDAKYQDSIYGQNIDVKAVLETLTQKIIHPDEFFARTLEANPNRWCNEDYLSSFIEQKLMLDVRYFDIKNSTDFSLIIDNEKDIFS